MTIQRASDLHLEFGSNCHYLIENPIQPKADVLILAGDTLNHGIIENKVIDQLSKDFKQVYLVSGNHEFYTKQFPNPRIFPDLELKLKSNVTYLNNRVLDIDDVKIIFTTLFTQIPSTHKGRIERYLGDFRLS